MRGKITKIVSAPKGYLELVGFTIRENKAKYIKRLWGDGLSATIYSAVSIWLICIQQADRVVFFLNTLLLLRAVLGNMISATQVTHRNDEVDIANKGRNYKYYHLKATAFTFIFIAVLFAWILIWLREGSSGLDIKFYSIIAILAVLFNDLENDFVCAYDAIINPIA